ncbi:uncharacterized protein [Ptychodera flava]|uniref:uncharacterized protein n=1 Tax=Ptychodera flava TaxID=63121 RepID=UPI003969F620
MEEEKRSRTLTPKGQEYAKEVKYKALGEAWRGLKSVSEEIKSLIAENPPIESAKDSYTKWMDKYEQFLNANDKYCALLQEDARAEHFERWYDEKDVWITNVKSKIENWFSSKSEEQQAIRPAGSSVTKAGSLANSKTSMKSKMSSVKLAEKAKELELQEREKLIKDKQALERKLKLLEIELQHQAESHEVQTKLAVSRAKSQLLDEIESDIDSQSVGSENSENNVTSEKHEPSNQRHQNDRMENKTMSKVEVMPKKSKVSDKGSAMF